MDCSVPRARTMEFSAAESRCSSTSDAGSISACPVRGLKMPSYVVAPQLYLKLSLLKASNRCNFLKQTSSTYSRLVG